VHLGAADVQRLGDERHGLRRDMAERRLHVVQDGQQGAFPIVMPAQNFSGPRFAPRSHGFPPNNRGGSSGEVSASALKASHGLIENIYRKSLISPYGGG
jgi:hypothetical protein